MSSTTHNAAAAGLTWEVVQSLDDAELEARVYPGPPTKRTRPEPSPAELHVALRRLGMTMELLRLESLAEHPDGLRYTAFCDRIRSWRARRSPWMRQVHHAGDKLFVDFSGKKPRIADPATDLVHDVELFVGVLGASNLTYAEAVPSQRIEDWIGHRDHGASGDMLPPCSRRSEPWPSTEVAQPWRLSCTTICCRRRRATTSRS